MAEANKSGIFAKAQKRISRTKTKVLQTLGKADKYTDETFDDLVQKTERQHDVAHHLQKEIRSYASCMKALSNASRNLATALGQTYEEEWTDSMEFKKLLEAQDLLWNDYMDSLQNSVMEPLNTYLASFPPLKVRTAKRRRKMTDYDNARHNLEVLQAAKKRDEAKITKAQEDLNECRQIFEDLHSELCTELPSFYNSRVTTYADLFQKLFSCEKTLHSELANVSEQLTDTSEKLSKDHVQFVYTPKRPLSKSLSDNSDEQPAHNGESSPQCDSPSSSSKPSPAATPTTRGQHGPTAAPRSSFLPPQSSSPGSEAAGEARAGGGGYEDDDDDENNDPDHVYGNQDAVLAAKINGDADTQHKPAQSSAYSSQNGPQSPGASSDTSNVYEPPPKGPHGQESDGDNDDDEDGELYQSPPSNKPVCEPPASTLFQVEATHTYAGEDDDELSFDPGDIVYVIPYENEDEQDDGWQMGIKQRDGSKGVFPENFTRRL